MIFGKSKNEILKSTQSEVFDIMRVGANISRLRKAAGITQTELADRLNVSFQAVSNWERGQSCPDIANLMELASIFGVSVDRILGSERAAKLVTEISEEKAPEMSAEEIKEIAPILDEAQADSVVRKNLMGEADTTEEEAADSGEEYESLSNVPAALLLSGFTDNARALLLGTNVGGLGTPIASLASLISLKLYFRSEGARPGRFMAEFTAANVILLVLLSAFCLLVM